MLCATLESWQSRVIEVPYGQGWSSVVRTEVYTPTTST